MADAAVERGDVPATQTDPQKLRSGLVEFDAAQTRRLALWQNLPPHASQGAPRRGSVAAISAQGPAARFAEESALSAQASEYWPRGKPTTNRIQV